MRYVRKPGARTISLSALLRLLLLLLLRFHSRETGLGEGSTSSSLTKGVDQEEVDGGAGGALAAEVE
ncbi:MAG: hypothetical protein OK454_08270, partial [Thaumarchaeota archaeon]|nr:hypothetical protein [Nitrososphaerota archaeon]